ncbi:hypothetical protein RM780_19840 [Streptomyces sp. DSM 44917]|uniref:Small hydrophilic protein n=1 Tax=Streptomyces boetiae TaxID=3075541 RepID=A0ABU2LC88_9ACTN|nr:hypothetical protein [Streptomyces sp. DSM 44917]MDT0309197.1 hypothetical protein [Streptomyces sp. DSM 44917]
MAKNRNRGDSQERQDAGRERQERPPERTAADVPADQQKSKKRERRFGHN